MAVAANYSVMSAPVGYVAIKHERVESFRTYYNLIAGGLTFVCNVYLLLRIVSTKSLRSQKEYTIIGANMLLDVFYGLAYFDKGFMYVEYNIAGTECKF